MVAKNGEMARGRRRWNAEATGEDRAKRLPNGLVGETKSGSKLVAGAADEIMARRSSEEIVRGAIVRAASRMGTKAEGGDVWQAAEVVVVEAMHRGSPSRGSRCSERHGLGGNKGNQLMRHVFRWRSNLPTSRAASKACLWVLGPTAVTREVARLQSG